jgi:hypothetical protein
MTRTIFNIRAAAIYLLLVGAPFTGLVTILRAGNHISAPFCVKGKWQIEASHEEASGSIAADLVTALRQHGLTISQSGTHLTLIINDDGKTTLTGELHGNTLTATGERPSTDLKSREQDARVAVSLSATIDTKSAPLSLQGSLTVQDRQEDSRPVLFSAQRQEDGRNSKGVL